MLTAFFVRFVVGRGVLVASIALLCGQGLKAADGTWTQPTSGGLWSDGTNNWASTTVADGSGSTAFFNTLDLTADHTVHLDSARTLTNLTFGDTATATPGGWILDNNGLASNILNLAGTTPTITVNALGAGKSVTISAVIGGSTGFTKAGTGALILSGANTYTGVTTVGTGTSASAGTLTVTGNQSAATGGWSINGTSTVNFNTNVVLGTGKTISFANGGGNSRILNVAAVVTTSTTSDIWVVGGNTINLNSGANWTQNGGLRIQPNTTFTDAAINVNSGASFTYAGGTKIILSASPGTNGGSGTLSISGGTFTTGQGFDNNSTGSAGAANLKLSNGGTLKLSAGISQLVSGTSLRPFNVQVGTGGGIIDTNGFNTELALGISNVSAQTGSLTKQGAGTLTLSGASAYTGDTTVTAGSLVVSGSLSGSLVAVNAGTFGGAGSVTTNDKTFTLASGAKLDPGMNGSTGLSVNTGSANFDLGAGVGGGNTGALLFNLGGVSASDKITLTLGTGVFNTGGALDFGDFAFTTSAGFGNGSYTLFSTNKDASGLLAGSGLSGTIAGFDATLAVSGNDIVLLVVPEPNALISLLGGIGVLLGLRRRRAMAF